MSQFLLRPLNDADQTALTDLWVAAWQATRMSIDFAGRRDWIWDHLATQRAKGALVICAEDRAGALTGFVTIDPAHYYLDQIAVAPHAQGSGLGSQLLDAARALSPTRLVLDVNVDNPRALRFYAREGFIQIGEGANAVSGLRTRKLEWRP